MSRSSGDRFRPQNGADMNVNPTPMQLWDQGKVLKRVVVLRQVPKSTSSFKSEAERFRVHSAPGGTISVVACCETRELYMVQMGT